MSESLRAYVTPKTLVTSGVIALAAYLAWKAGQKLVPWPSDELPHPVQEEGPRTAEENDELVGELTVSRNLFSWNEWEMTSLLDWKT